VSILATVKDARRARESEDYSLQHLGEIGLELPVRCHCGRRFGVAKFVPGMNRVMITGTTRGDNLGKGDITISLHDGALWLTDPAGNETLFQGEFTAEIPARSHRPSQKMVLAEPPEGGPDRRWQFICHPNCGAKPMLTERHLTKSFVRAARAGRRELRFGDNL
jgi:hypothetical protein